MHYAWLIGSLTGLAIWCVIYAGQRRLRRQMLRTSLWTAPLGLTERLFVPAYWDPPSLFDLTKKTGFDIESILFAFAIGGVASVLYELVFQARLVPMSTTERQRRRHRFHRLALLSPALFFVLFLVTTDWNPIYCFVDACVLGSLAAMVCRPDLAVEMVVGGLLFTGLYFLFFIGLLILFPEFIRTVWNLPALSGIILLGIPLEEYLFAFSFGMLWSSLYEHIYWQRIISGRQGTSG